jgi:soluble lytic murein transglycosylase-like protein
MAFSSTVESAIKKYSAQYNVDADLIRAIIQVESGGNPNALGDYDSAGVPHSFGLMQLNDKGAGAGYSRSYLLNVDNNVNLGTKYLKACLNAFPGDLKTGISAYNQGIGGARTRGWTYNRAYVERVLSYYGVPVPEKPEEVVQKAIAKGIQIVPSDSETKVYWKNTFNKISEGCLTRVVFFAIIIGTVIYLILR